ncbi:hypothetical protein IAD21_00684 [Abditibacteriota bacterium]|nr:hypothetical protein IAD21_00684 [Abditibacteriota bacterium]
MSLIPLKKLVPGALSAYQKGAPNASSFVGLQKGGVVQDTLNGTVSVNTGTPAVPAYTALS